MRSTLQFHMAQLTCQPGLGNDGRGGPCCSCPLDSGGVGASPTSFPQETCPSQHSHSSKVDFQSSAYICGNSRVGSICLSLWCFLEEFRHGKPTHDGSFFIKICAVEIMLIKLECNYGLERFFAG